jgi:hypothetical protein
MRELCNYLASESPHLAGLLVPQCTQIAQSDTKNNISANNKSNSSSSSSSSGTATKGTSPRGSKAARLMDSDSAPAHTPHASSSDVSDAHAQSVQSMVQPSSNSLSHMVLGPLTNLHPRNTSRVLPLAFLAARVVATGVGGGVCVGGLKSASGSEGAEGGAESALYALDTQQKVHDFLRRCGIPSPEDVNPCLKAGLLKGHLKVPAELLTAPDASAYLDTALLTDKCPNCSKMLTCTVRQALFQSTHGGDYGDTPGGGEGGAVGCGRDTTPTTTTITPTTTTTTTTNNNNNEGEGGGGGNSSNSMTVAAGIPPYICTEGSYISSLCQGKPRFDCGKSHNHCTQCPDFGTCIYDYR